MVIIKVDLQAKKEEILNELPFLLEQVMSSNEILIDNLEFHTKSRSGFGLLYTAYLMAQRSSHLELQVSYLKCPCYIQENISSHVREKWFNEW